MVQSSGTGQSNSVDSKGRSIDDHDWHSQTYVSEWMTKDRGRTARRQPLFQRMIDAVPFAKDAALRVIDVGGGYGAVSEAMLQAFPQAQVTLQDYSQAMLDRARGYLSAHAPRMSYALGDLTDPNWTKQFDAPFDLAVSAIAIHNLMEMPLIAASYRAIHSILKPGAVFIDCDHFDHVEDIDAHMAALKQAGFSQVDCLWRQKPSGILRAKV